MGWQAVHSEDGLWLVTFVTKWTAELFEKTLDLFWYSDKVRRNQFFGGNVMAQAKNGDTVTVHFTGKFENGDVFDTSQDGQPLEFTLGNESMMPGFEAGVLGMAVGESKTISVASEDAYGQRQDGMIATLEKSEFPDHISPEVGQQIEIKHPEGGTFRVLVTEVTDESVTLDGNHPLAGKDLVFDIELVSIQ